MKIPRSPVIGFHLSQQQAAQRFASARDTRFAFEMMSVAIAVLTVSAWAWSPDQAF